MALPAIVVSHTVAVAALKEGLSLCQSIISYRIATQQIELQRDRMHAEANIIIQQLDHDYKVKLANLNTIADAHKITLKGINTSSKEVVNMVESGQLELDKYLNIIVSPDVSNDIKQSMMTVISQLSQQQAQLVNNHMQSSQAPINAFAMMLDRMRDSDQPRTFTDVS
ncbi:hypothetical protein FHS24_000616 [Psychrobacter luti]|uniref:Uncharacterized protein n=1 Tax=Psychrobacter luti TaxID=198481 RepID=A0A839TDK3_9GAMM|nr:hypothetical protein [Psychrobacter luti]MBB3106125.1 hypothetical protein [Psychrobacter luti]